MKALLIGAITTSAIAICATAFTPTLSRPADLPGLARAAAIVLWIAWFGARHHKQLNAARAELADARAEVDQVRRLTKIEGLLKEAGVGTALTLPTPHGSIHPVPADIDGQPVLVGIDESAKLADIIELRRVISDGDGQAAL